MWILMPAAFLVCFILWGCAVLILDYVEHYQTAVIKMKYKDFKYLYQIAPKSWATSNQICCYCRGEKEYYVYFSFVDYWKYRRLLKKMRKNRYVMNTNEQMAEFLTMLQEDVEHYKTAAIYDQIDMFSSIKRNQYRHNAYINIEHL